MEPGDLSAALRRRLVGELLASGDLRSPAWRAAVEAVPREAFLGDMIYKRAGGPIISWEPVVRTSLGAAAWLELAYRNETWVTQLDPDRDPLVVGQGASTSSSTLPGLVVRMLEDLEVSDGMNVLEVGTGTGYSTALLCSRVGSALVSSVEVDPAVASRARQTLFGLGYRPTLVVGDGLAGVPRRAPFDRVIGTCSVRAIPDAWLHQTCIGGKILAPLIGWLFGCGMVSLVVREPGVATGRFLPGTVSFMPAPAHAPAPLRTLPPKTGPHRAAEIDPTSLDDWTIRFLAQLALPMTQHVRIVADQPGAPPSHLLVDAVLGAYAWVTAARPDGWVVVQDGPDRLWDRFEQTIADWRSAGSPSQDRFELVVTPTTQTVRVRTDHSELSWQLPHRSERDTG